MSDKDLILKLNSLKNINPDEAFLKSNRELLLSQISNSGAKEISFWQNFIINLSSLSKAAAQPVYAFGVFVFVLISASLFSNKLFSSAKPNDSLYIARVISEQAKLSTVMNQESRDKLAVQFANNRAQDISAVLADPTFNNEKNKDQVAKLNTSFNEEIATVKTKIQNLAPAKTSVAVNPINNNNDSVSIAENNKDANGVQLLENTSSKTVVNNLKADASSTIKNATVTLPIVATTTPAENKQAAAISSSDSAVTAVDEAQKLSDSKDIKKAAEKLNEAVNEIIK